MNADYLVVTLRIVAIVTGGLFLNYLLQKILFKLNQDNILESSLFNLVNGIVKWIIIILVILLICHQLGVPLSRILTSLSAILVLIAIGFVAVWSVLSNILSAFLLLLFRPFKLGDVIELKDPEKEKGICGEVSSLNIFYTTLKDVSDNASKNTYVSIPNNMFFQRVIICHKGTGTSKLQIKMDGNDNDSG